MVVVLVVVAVVVVVVLTVCFTRVSVHSRAQMHQIMGTMSLWTRLRDPVPMHTAQKNEPSSVLQHLDDEMD